MDDQWNAIRDFFPAQFSRRSGRPWADHRRIVNAIQWILHTGRPWRSLPANFGSWQTAYNRFRRWLNNDLWDEVYAVLLHQADACGNVVRSLWCVDAAGIRAHR
ncbi:transposase [Bremerella sp. JC817]|uniref:transposase n=1 Tax=Bremerella sp. JC817 TaxID=3231756 RepID=UPI00345AED3F